MSLVPIRHLINNHKGIQKNQNFLYLSTLVFEWPNLVGSQISNNTTVVGFKDGVVKVSVTSATWATELSAIKNELILQINNMLGNSKDPVRDIVFHVDSNAQDLDLDRTVHSKQLPSKKVPLDDKERATLEVSVSCISNEKLRDLAIKVTSLDLETKKGARTRD